MVSSKLIFIMIAMCTGIAVSVAGYLDCKPCRTLRAPVVENRIETPHGASMLPLVESLMPVEREFRSKPRVERFVLRSRSQTRPSVGARVSQPRVRSIEVKVEASGSGQPTIGVIETYF